MRRIFLTVISEDPIMIPMVSDPLPFLDRADAGRELARKMLTFKGKKSVLILGLLRGGVEVGRALADALKLPLFPYAVRKIGHPENPEYALGALAEGGGTFLDEPTMHASGLDFADIEPIIEEEMKELSRRKSTFRSDPLPPLDGKTVILTDDGAATGSTLFATIEDMRKAQVRHLIIALPVAPHETVRKLRESVDEVIVLAEPSPFLAVGQWYITFTQLTDEEVQRMLHSAPRNKRIE